ncbi:MAG: hypothetical protein ACUVQ8_06585 [Nitrososphaeria archaeon]
MGIIQIRLLRFKPNILKLIFGVYFLFMAMKFITSKSGIMIW